MSFVDNTIDLPWRNFVSPEFDTKSLIFQIPRFPYRPYNTVWDRYKEASVPRISSIRPVVSIQYRLVADGRTDRRTDIYDASKYRAKSIAG